MGKGAESPFVIPRCNAVPLNAECEAGRRRESEIESYTILRLS